MSRYTGPVHRKARRVGFSILETGKELLKKPNVPGQHGGKRTRKPSNYAIQLKEKQKVRFMYGVSEKQFKKTFLQAKKLKGVLGEDFLKLLESRLDNLVYRIGFANTRKGARQLVNHGHVLVNNKKVDIPSYQVKPGDEIAIREKSKNLPVILSALEGRTSRVEYVTFDLQKMAGNYLRYPEQSEFNSEIDIALVVEYYNK